MSSAESDDTDPTKAEIACFEVGIKFGSLYHQFAGTPVSSESADSLARAMEEAIENQPHCESVTIEIDEEALAAAADGAYTELTGRFMTVEIVVAREGRSVTARMAMDDGYPLMEIVSVADDN
ncbi:dihydroneopterin aldolase family protein [Halococcus qingdaonensis]|uniref:dihydroneopterin aldolase family protein n=1 Tax=Halococcus qingdaonensis TaxID=224402 RepID=UPI0021165A78|nr:dihydroneopterin aldolase family protein [Halococcus qingdaonensis]